MNKEQKKEQEVINYVSENLYDMAYTEYKKKRLRERVIWKKLRSCLAEVCETDNFYILRSYNTIVAVIEKGSDILADVLRLVYGYTSTSAQHIAKFRHDYGADKWGCKIEYRYYPVN